jgi:DNA-binding beta-propeller fold protein YncE
MRTSLRLGAAVVVGSLAVAIPLVFGAFAGAGSELQTLDPARNTPLPCEELGSVKGQPVVTRSAKNINHLANVCGFVGTDTEFQSRKDAAGNTHDYAFIGTMGGGLRIYDITNPGSPVFAGGYLDAGWENDIQVWGNIASSAFDGVNGEPSTTSLCLKTKYPGANDAGVDLFQLRYNPAAAASGAGPHFTLTNPTCIANPPGGAHNHTVNPQRTWIGISNCCSDWAIDVIDIRPVTVGKARVDLADTGVPVNKYRLIDETKATADKCQGRTAPPGPVTCIVMKKADGSSAAGLWRPHDIHFSKDGKTMFVAAINSTWIVDVANVLSGQVRTLAVIPNRIADPEPAHSIEISHQADITPDGKVLVVNDEKGGGLTNTDCNSMPNGQIGALHFYALAPIRGIPASAGASLTSPKKLGEYVNPSPLLGPDPLQEAIEALNGRRVLNGLPRLERGCTSHVFRISGNGTASPGEVAPGFDGVSRLPSYRLVEAWYGAGVWYIDFSGPARADDGVAEDPRTTWGNTLAWNVMPGADTWSAKEYKGKIAAADMLRGFDTFALSP